MYFYRYVYVLFLYVYVFLLLFMCCIRLRLLYNGDRVLPGGKERPRCEADPSHPSSAVVKKE